MLYPDDNIDIVHNGIDMITVAIDIRGRLYGQEYNHT